MKKILIVSAIAALGSSMPVIAGPDAAAQAHAGVGAFVRVGGGAGVGAGGHAGASAGAGAGVRGPSATAMENSNGRFAADREFGRERAAERMSAQGAAHERASTAPNNKKGGKPERVTPPAGVSASGGASVEAGARSR